MILALGLPVGPAGPACRSALGSRLSSKRLSMSDKLNYDQVTYVLDVKYTFKDVISGRRDDEVPERPRAWFQRIRWLQAMPWLISLTGVIFTGWNAVTSNSALFANNRAFLAPTEDTLIIKDSDKENFEMEFVFQNVGKGFATIDKFTFLKPVFFPLEAGKNAFSSLGDRKQVVPSFASFAENDRFVVEGKNLISRKENDTQILIILTKILQR